MSATAVTQVGQGERPITRPTRTKSFFIWAGLSLLGFPLGGLLGHAVAGRVDGVTPALIGGALTGAGIGLAQWWMLRRTLGVGPEWIVATSGALGVGLALGAMAVGYETSISQLAIMGAISGAPVGIVQGLLLRSKFSLWHMWMVAMPAFWAIGWATTTAGGIDVDKQFTVFGAYGAVAFAILSWLLLMAGTRREKLAAA